jgi:hypothetical protein
MYKKINALFDTFLFTTIVKDFYLKSQSVKDEYFNCFIKSSQPMNYRLPFFSCLPNDEADPKPSL